MPCSRSPSTTRCLTSPSTMRRPRASNRSPDPAPSTRACAGRRRRRRSTRAGAGPGARRSNGYRGRRAAGHGLRYPGSSRDDTHHDQHEKGTIRPADAQDHLLPRSGRSAVFSQRLRAPSPARPIQAGLDAPQDWMREPQILAKTGLSVRELATSRKSRIRAMQVPARDLHLTRLV